VKKNITKKKTMSNKIIATDFYNYRKCKFLPYIEKHGDQRKKVEVSRFVRLLWERGLQHEDKIIEEIIGKDGRTFARIKKTEPVNKRTFEKTIALMKRGIDYIYQGVLLSDNYAGRPDLLEKVKGSSKFGNYYYIPVDIKSGKGYRGDSFKEGKPKISYKLQLTFYVLLLSQIQEYKPSFGKIINIDKEELKYKISTKEKRFQKVLDEIEQMTQGKKLYEPAIGGKCSLCPWQDHCFKWAKERQDLSLLFSLGTLKYGMQDYGVKKIDDILDKPLDKWLDELEEIKDKGYFYRISKKKFKKIYKRAEVFKEGKERIYSKLNFPETSKEIHFDIEDDPTQDVVYLFGFWIRDFDKNQEYYKYIMADNLEEEEEVTRKLWDFLKKNQGTPIYHYSHHEISTLKRLQEKYDLDKSVIDQLEEDSVDLYRKVKRHSDWPLYSYGLKAICKYIGFSWSAADAGGANSIEWFSQFLKGDKKMKEKILKYNTEDCQATAYLKDYLVKKSKNL